MANDNLVKLIPNARVWGPCEPEEACDLVERVLDDKQTTELFRRYAIGEITPRELADCIELSFEAAEAQLRASALAEPQYEEEWEHA